MNGGDEEILTAVLAGDLDVDDPRVGGLSSAARARLDELLRVQRRLVAEGSRERELLAQVEATAAGPVPSEVSAFLAEQTAQSPAPLRVHRRVVPRRVAGIAALAAGIFLLVYSSHSWYSSDSRGWSRGGPVPSRVGSGTLGERADVTPIHPVGEFEAGGAEGARAPLEPFRWRGELPKFTRFRLRIWTHDELAVDSKGERIVERQLTTNEWIPDVSLPERFHWSVDVLPFEGAAQAGFEVEAWQRH